MSKDALAGVAAVVSVRPVGEPADAFQRALREERRRSARQINAFRLQALSVFLVVVALLQLALSPAWVGPSFALFAGWWAAAAAVHWGSRTSPPSSASRSPSSSSRSS